MLTGDKIETATSIAISSGLKSKVSAFFFMRELKQSNVLKIKLNELEREDLTRITLVIDGSTLDTILSD
jgi:magnesium-transporting ATPase (P-type)